MPGESPSRPPAPRPEAGVAAGETTTESGGIAGWRSAPPPPPSEPPPRRATPATSEAASSIDDLLEGDDDLDTVPPGKPPGAPSTDAGKARDAWLAAVRGGDEAALEALLAGARARGVDADIVDRVSGIAFLLRGEIDSAVDRIDRDGPSTTRPLLAKALLAMARADLDGGVRLAAEALLLARRRNDRAGIAASLRALEACYRALGRDDQAQALRDTET